MKNLYIVATPIGNLEDISLRALKILKEVSTIFCEDTRHSKKLLDFYGISNNLISLHKFNESSRQKMILNFLEKGDVAIISDAGTPLISDPGQYIIKKIIAQGVNVIPIPGANSISTALSVSGLFFDSFIFLGFADKSKEQLIKTIQQNLHSDLLVFFESPKRIRQTLQKIFDYYGDAEIVIAKELTKIYEQMFRGKINEILENKQINLSKGELILIINSKSLNYERLIFDLIEQMDIKNLSKSQQIKILKSYLPISKNYLYNLFKK